MFLVLLKNHIYKKRDNLNLFIAKKKGKLLKLAPDNYGMNNCLHYYFIHAYNCIYECDYCYLQGYFNSPDIVFFVNHDEICLEIKKISAEFLDKSIWFHAGEFSDSLALNNITNELPIYFNLMDELKKDFLELRTKSINIKKLLNLTPLKNIIISFSIATKHQIDIHDLKTPSLELRIIALKKLQEKGFKIALHLDPIIFYDNLFLDVDKLFFQLKNNLDLKQIKYISIGVVRFSKKIFF